MYATLTPLVDGGDLRFARWLGQNARNPLTYLRSLNLRRASERQIVVIVMQSRDNSLTTYRKRGMFGGRMTTKQGQGERNPNWIPVGNEVTRRLAENMGGDPKGMLNDVFNIPTTAHFIGGCPIGDSPETGVVDPYQRLYGHPGLHVIDGSTLSANLGVNPSLTITAQSERALALWPNKGEADPRPELGTTYRRIRAVAPKNPAVPDAAPGAPRLPVVDIT